METTIKKVGEKEGEIASENDASEQEMEEMAAAKLKELDFGSLIKQITNEEPDQNAEAALVSFLAKKTVKVMQKASRVRKRRQMQRIGAAAVIIAAKQ